MPKALPALAALFLIAHLAWSPATFGDIDAINFALGVRDFDVAAHQPHPPGYPVFIAAAKASTAMLRALGVTAPEVRGIVLLNALAGASGVLLLFTLFRTLVREISTAAAATVITVCAPLFWFTASRPLSDTTGVVCALAAQALLLSAIVRRGSPGSAATALILGALVAGLATGIRSQILILTGPLLAAAVLLPGSERRWRDRLLAAAAFAVGILLWAVPLVALSGGIDGYLAALGDQAGEDFTGAVMLWTTRTPRAALNALQYTFVWPWGGLVTGAVIVVVATVGLVRIALTSRYALALLALAFGPYAVFHLVFQETVMTRYALPLVAPVALLAACGLRWAGERALQAGTLLFVVAAAVMTVSPWLTFARTASPGSRIVADAQSVDGAAFAGMHAVMRRHDTWYQGPPDDRVIRAAHGREVLALVDRWRESPGSTIAFMADASRTDLAMLDPRARARLRTYDWGFPEMPLLGGARPSQLELFALRPPGWMLDQGWAVTAEVAGQSFRAGARPEVRPSIAWARSREHETTLVIGGRHLGPASAPSAIVSVALPNAEVARFEIQPGFFVRTFTLAEGTLRSADAYVPLRVEAAPAAAGDVRVSLEQFDLQEAGVPMHAFLEGWQEPEYNRLTGVAWRWASARATLWVRPVGRDVTLTIRAESPLRYFDASPALRLSVGGQQVATLSPASDFTWEVQLPRALLDANDGIVLLESDKWFVPGGDGSGDQRQLALRVYSVVVN